MPRRAVVRKRLWNARRQPRNCTIASAVASKSSQRTLCPPGTSTRVIWPLRRHRDRDPRPLAADDERRAARPGRRRRRHLAPGDDHRGRSVLPAEATVRALDEMLARFLLERLARRREDRAVAEPGLDRLVRARERDVRAASDRRARRRWRRRAASRDRAGRRTRPDPAAGPPPRRRACRRSCAPPTPPRRSRARRSSRGDRRRAARRSTAAPSPNGRGRGSRPRRRGTSGGAPRRDAGNVDRARRRRAGTRSAALPDPPTLSCSAA